ncbi:MAG: SGNH/GDSL hydrolase family protein, partial [Planctomycetaceae bacterium]|nr:SGNH/GDSL hydrolase family protein [Planctomycetaceae bacterium]
MQQTRINSASPETFLRIVIVFAIISACGFSDRLVSADKPQPAPAFKKILFLGNSITLHGPSKKIGWEGNWGMAASSLDKDYVHIVTDSFTKSSGNKPQTMVKNIAA